MIERSSERISWDAVLCRGPLHNDGSTLKYIKNRIASIALGPQGCRSCCGIPEGVASSKHVPLLSPPPTREPLIERAKQPPRDMKTDKPLPFHARCAHCLSKRCCWVCGKWWCETCYQIGDSTCYASRHAEGPQSQGTRPLEGPEVIRTKLCLIQHDVAAFW